MKMKVKNLAGKGTIELDIVDVKSLASLRQYLYTYQTNQRQGTSSTKTRAEVNGSGKKIYKQKGTGNARHGDKYSNIFVGGGVAFGPKPKDWSISITKGIKLAAILTAFNINKDNIYSVELPEFTKPETSKASKILKDLKGKRTLVITKEIDTNVVKSFKNIPFVEIRPVRLVNAYDLVIANDILLEKGAEALIAERLKK